MQLCYEFYKRWVQNNDIDPKTTCRNIARRDYALFVEQAGRGVKEAQEMVMALHIDIDEEGNIRPRTITELTNDVAVCNHIIRFFMTDESPRHKAMYLNSAEWLIRTGKQQNNDRADVSIVKRDRVNYTDEYKKKMARKYGLTAKDMQDIAEEESLQEHNEKVPDYMEYMEEVLDDRAEKKEAEMDIPEEEGESEKEGGDDE